MCGTCGCRDAESYEAPFFEMDGFCLSCGADEVAYESNICEKCQIKLGVKKLGEFRAETFDAEYDFQNQAITTVEADDETEAWDTFGMYGVEEDWALVDVRDAESFEAEEWDFGNDREALRNSDENSDFNNAWRRIFKSKRREWPSWGQKFYDKYKWTLDDPTWNPYAKGGDFEDEEEPKGFRDAESFEAQRKLTDVDRDGKPYTGKIYPDHPNLDSVKADRNNDGYMSSWERALGNQVARGMERGGYSAEGAVSRFPWKTLIAVAVGVFAVSRIKNVEFKSEGGCGCGCSGGGGCGDKKSAEGYPEVYDPVADFLPRYRYPADSVWSNDYNPADPYRPLDYQTVHTDSNTKAKRM
tara:strand:- start:31503 stop:32570 length:1068 start_codon:yes stop_codon:yes gene_type:complete